MPDEKPPNTVRLEGVSARLFLESQDHQHDLIRELQLIQFGDRYDVSVSAVSSELAQLISGILSRYSVVRAATRAQAVAALDRGEEHLTLEVPVQPEMGPALREWLRLLDEADRLCGDDQLLLLASRPEVRELRRWYVAEITAQLDRRS
ncbi:MAG TPA: hypothetical protein VNB94_12360 [Mycobacteriales bacterium]|nr:hypothetical protein [Mycobacteriales bacterium]